MKRNRARGRGCGQTNGKGGNIESTTPSCSTGASILQDVTRFGGTTRPSSRPRYRPLPPLARSAARPWVEGNVGMLSGGRAAGASRNHGCLRASRAVSRRSGSYARRPRSRSHPSRESPGKTRPTSSTRAGGERGGGSVRPPGSDAAPGHVAGSMSPRRTAIRPRVSGTVWPGKRGPPRRSSPSTHPTAQRSIASV